MSLLRQCGEGVIEVKMAPKANQGFFGLTDIEV
jgi:hypothetical protein